MRPRLVYSDELTRYDFGEAHPMGPGRVRMAIELARQLGVLDQLDVVPPPPADDALLRLVHTEDYIQAVIAERPMLHYGIGTPDNPVMPGMHEVASLICTATTAAARMVWGGESHRAANLAGGLHHAMPSLTSGFCVYNDCAVAIRWLQRHGAARIAYVDVDAHHGDGVQHIFYDDPSVLTISLHESPVHLFPGTGFAQETGVRGPWAVLSTSRCHRAPMTRAGCGPLPRSCRRCWPNSVRRSWSASTGATPTPTIR